jgi:hypothetical protein
MSRPDAARMAGMSWPDANPAFRRRWGYGAGPKPPGAGRFLLRTEFPAPRIVACIDPAVLNGRALRHPVGCGRVA